MGIYLNPGNRGFQTILNGIYIDEWDALFRKAKNDEALQKEYVQLDGGESMSEKRLNNTIFLMYLVTDSYCKAHNITSREFLDLDRRYAILNYVSECPDVFDSMTEGEMVQEVEEYVS